MMVTAMIVPARAEMNRLQFEAGDACGDIEPGLSLHADRLQGVGILRATDQEIAATADADRGVGTHATVIAGEFAASEPAVRRIHGPGELGLLGEAEIDANATYGCDVGLGPASLALEHAFKARHRADDEADILAALALQDAGANRRQRVGAGDRRDQRDGGEGECRNSHWYLSPHEERDCGRTRRKRHVENKAFPKTSKDKPSNIKRSTADVI